MFTMLSCNTQGKHRETLDFLAMSIKTYNPDIFFLQEVRIDQQTQTNTPLMLQDRFSSYYGYYSSVFDFSRDYGKGSVSKYSIQEGLFTLSKYPLDLEYRELPIVDGLDRWPRGLQYINCKGLKIAHIHMSKHKISREGAMATIPQSDIIVGDYNMQYGEVYEYFGVNYSIAYQSFPYISYPTKAITLDHCCLRNGEFISVKTIPIDRSDHNAVVYALCLPKVI